MNTTKIDALNIALMLFACAAAFVVPFELFLFSYAVLGPLHCLTEIPWLHKRDYFTTGRFDFAWLAGLCLVLCIFSFVVTSYPGLAHFVIYLAFASALSFVLFNDWRTKVLFIVCSVFAGWLLVQLTPVFFVITLLLPTLIHVFVFTGLFILGGALKNKNTTGIISLVVFGACAISFFIFTPNFGFYSVSDYAKKAMESSGMVALNQTILGLTNTGNPHSEMVFASNAGLAAMRFIAFAYFYHILNWFSKTSIIKWHEVPKKWLFSVIAIWVLTVAMYAYDFKVGIIPIYLLSMLHAFLEFPLNYRSAIGIGRQIAPTAVWHKLAAFSKK